MTEVLVNIDVPDLKLGVDFYTRGLNFALRRHLFEGTVAELHCGAVKIFLIEHAQDSVPFAGAQTRRTFTRHWTPVHLDVVVENLQAALDQALAHGATAAAEPSASKWGTLAPLADPFGHGICLIEFSPQGYDAAADDVQ